MTSYFQVCEVSTSFLTKLTFPIFHELCLHEAELFEIWYQALLVLYIV